MLQFLKDRVLLREWQTLCACIEDDQHHRLSASRRLVRHEYGWFHSNGNNIDRILTPF
jgi:hypothetical protein